MCAAIVDRLTVGGDIIQAKPATIDDGLGRRAHPPRIRCSRAWLGLLITAPPRIGR